MSLEINTNIGALQAAQLASTLQTQIQQTVGSVASGKRINSAADDSGAFSVASRMHTRINSSEVGIRNAINGISLVQTADASMTNVNDMLHRMRELSIQSSGEHTTATNRVALNTEFQQLQSEINRSLHLIRLMNRRS